MIHTIDYHYVQLTFTLKTNIAHAAYFSVYEGMKVAVGADKPGHHPIQAALCGSLAALSHDMFMTPMDTVKQRMQLGYYKNVFHCIRTVIRTEGIRSLYASFPTTVLMNLPYGAIMLATNESMKKILNPSDEYSVPASMVSGSIAGLVAAACTNPLDVIKTRLQTRSLGSCPVETSTNIPTIPIVRVDFTTTDASLSSSSSLSSPTQILVNSQSATRLLETPIVYKVSSSSSSTNSTGRNVYTELLLETRQVARVIVKNDGYTGFWRGVGPRMIVHAPSVAVSWTVYEGLKDALSSSE